MYYQIKNKCNNTAFVNLNTVESVTFNDEIKGVRFITGNNSIYTEYNTSQQYEIEKKNLVNQLKKIR